MVQTAIAETQQVSPTKTVEPAVAATPEPTMTAIPSPTADLQVFDIDPSRLLLQKSEIPVDGQYYIPHSSWTSPHRNSEIISGMGVEAGRDYLAETGRVDGWWQIYKRGTSRVQAPEEIYNNPVLYRDAQGAMLLLTKYSQCLEFGSGFSQYETDIVIGDGSIICFDQEMEPSGPRRSIRIEFVRRNVYQALQFWGWEHEVQFEFAIETAQNLLLRMDQIPLSDSVSFSP